MARFLNPQNSTDDTSAFDKIREMVNDLEALCQSRDITKEPDLWMDLERVIEVLRRIHNDVNEVDWLHEIVYAYDSDGTPTGVSHMTIIGDEDTVLNQIMHKVMWPGEPPPEGCFYLSNIMRRKEKELAEADQPEIEPKIEEIDRRTERGWLYTTCSRRTIRFTVPEESRTWTMHINFNGASKGFAGQILRYASGDSGMEWDSLLAREYKLLSDEEHKKDIFTKIYPTTAAGVVAGRYGDEWLIMIDYSDFDDPFYYVIGQGKMDESGSLVVETVRRNSESDEELPLQGKVVKDEKYATAGVSIR